MFGNGKTRTGLMIVPSAAAQHTHAEELKQLLMPAIKAANENMPGYGRICEDMVGVLPVGTVFPVTDKGTVMRAAFWKQFEDEIESIYRRTDD